MPVPSALSAFGCEPATSGSSTKNAERPNRVFWVMNWAASGTFRSYGVPIGKVDIANRMTAMNQQVASELAHRDRVRRARRATVMERSPRLTTASSMPIRNHGRKFGSHSAAWPCEITWEPRRMSNP